jgi:uncharacterized protein YwgA
MKDRAVTLLALLDANDRLGQPEIYRTVLMKQAFLAETIRPLYRQWRRLFTFVRYLYGPYSEDVFYRLDVLIFNGLAEVTSFERTRGRLEARYKITEAGRHILSQIDANEISQLATDLVWALQTLGIEQAGTIAKLVYQEAEFARLFAQHAKAGISASAKVQLPTVTSANNETLITLATLQGLRDQHLQSQPGSDEFMLPARELVRLFLEYLAIQVPRRGRSEQV